ncbi:MAG: ABC transporter ATP-binding protein [Lachnospiraceae bacterium]|nr:ABC transporter ATP-binding protein [Lachnospiraceae bacterium]
MKTVFKYLKKYTGESILAPSFKMLEALMDLFVPIVVARIINTGILQGNRSYVIREVLLLLGLAALGMGFSFTAQWFSAKASVGTASDIRQALFDHIQELSCSELDTLGTDTLITRMTSDINQIQNGLNLTLRLLLRSPFIVFGAMIMAFTIDVKCALIFAVAIPLLSVVVFSIMLISIPLFAKVQAKLDSLLSLTRENLTGVRVIRAFCKEQEEIREFDARNEMLTKMNEHVGRISALLNPATYVLINLATIMLIRQGALRVNLGMLQQGDVVALYNYMAQIIVELIKLATLIISITRSIACAKRVEGIFEVRSGMAFPDDETGALSSAKTGGTKNEKKNGQSAAQQNGAPAVVFNHVSFSYAGSGAEALTDIDFTAKRGETIGIIGGTGSGKSSVVSLIPRFYDVTKGSVEVFGEDVRSYKKGELIEHIGIVPQKAVLFEGSIRQNLKWGREDATDEELMAAARIAQADGVIEGKNGGLSAMIEQNGRNLSGGQRQRLTIARALVRNPEILILDDSASALDFATDLALRRAIKSLPGDMTVFIVSQRTSSVRTADRILVLDDGLLVGQGTHDELMKTCTVYQEIYYSQFPEERPQ